MLALRLELEEQLRQAVMRAQAEKLWPCTAQPDSYALIDAPEYVGGDISWPGLRTLPGGKDLWDRAAAVLPAVLELPSGSPVRPTGFAAGFVNFAWTVPGREYILRRAAERDSSEVQGTSLPREVAYAVKRTIWLEKMAGDQLADNCVSPPGEIWAKALTRQEETALISGIERLAQISAKAARRRRPQPALSLAIFLSQAWGVYYEHRALLKGTAAQIRARAALGRALRAVLLSVPGSAKANA